jgi:hypothetical protein
MATPDSRSLVRTQSRTVAAGLCILGHRPRIVLKSKPGDTFEELFEFSASARADYQHLIARIDELRLEAEALIRARRQDTRRQAQSSFIQLAEMLEGQRG